MKSLIYWDLCYTFILCMHVLRCENVCACVYAWVQTILSSLQEQSWEIIYRKYEWIT